MSKRTTLLSFVTPLVFSLSAFAQSDHYESALQAFNKNDIEDAFIHIKNALQNDPENLPAKLLLAKIFVEKHAYDMAEQELLDAIDQGVDINLIVQPLGKSLLLQAKYNQALTFVQQKELSQQGRLAFNLIKAEAYSGLEDFEKAENSYQNILAFAPNNVDALLGLAGMYINAKQVDNAKNIIDKITPIAPSNAKLWRLKGIIARAENTPEQALKHFDKANNLEAENIATYRGLTNSFIDLGNYQQAHFYLDKMLAISPKDPQAQLMKSNVLQALNKDTDAQQILSQLSHQLSAIDESYLHSQPQLLLIDSMTSFSQKNWEQARSKFQLYLEQKPNDINAVVLLADVYIKLDEPKKALKLLTKHERELMNNKDHALVLAGLYLQFEQKFKAEYLLGKLRKLYKDDISVAIFSAKIMSQTGRLTEALDLLEQFEGEQPVHFNHTLAVLYYRTGQLDKSLEKITIISAQAPENIEYQLLHASVLIELEQYADAKIIITDVYQNNKENAEARSSYAILQAKLGNLTQARDIFKDLVKENKDHGENWLTLASLEYDLGNVEEAVDILKQQTKNDEVKKQALHQLAQVYFNLEEYDQSLIIVGESLKNNRLDTDALEMKFNNALALYDLKEAKRQTEILQGLWTSQPIKLLQLSQMQQKVREHLAAEESLERALKLAPNNLSIITASIKLKLGLNKISEAEALLKTAKKGQHKKHIHLIILSGDVAKEKNQLNTAFSLYVKALKQQDDNIIALIKLANVSTQAPRIDKFSAYTAQLVEQYPERAFQQNILADHLMAHHQYQQAKFQYQQLLTKEIPIDKRAIALNNLAIISIEEKTYPLAVDYAQQALSMLGSVPAIIDTYGWSLTLSGEPSKGLRYLRQAYTMASNSPDIQYHIGYTLAKLKRYEEAQEMLQKVMSFPESVVEHALAKQLLEELKGSNS